MSYKIRLMICALALAFSGLQAQAQKACSKPNIVLIFADDQSFETVHTLSNEAIETPNIDRLAQDGLTFTRAYNMGGWSPAVCIPSRTMLNTGRFLWHTQPQGEQTEDLRLFKEGKLWSQIMADAGYDTYMTGKWHLRADAAKAFAFTRHVRLGMPKDTPEAYNRPHEGQPDPWSPSDPKFGGYWEGGTHWSEVLRQDAIDFMKQATERDRPFFMYLAFNATHDPRQSPKEYIDKYPLDRMALPVNFLPRYPYMNDIGCEEKLRDESLAPFPRTPYAIRVHRQEYYALASHMDTQIGGILDTLKQSGLNKNTYIFYTADQGLAVGHHGLLGKQNLFDHSIRVPLMVVGPDVPANTRTDSPVYLQDVMPTSLELAGIAKPDHVEFKSLTPFFKDRKARSYDAIYSAYLDLQRAVTYENYKLILYPKIKKVLLFDLANDPNEMKNLADEPARQGTVKKLFAKLLDLQKETGDTLDLKTVYPAL